MCKWRVYIFMLTANALHFSYKFHVKMDANSSKGKLFFPRLASQMSTQNDFVVKFVSWIAENNKKKEMNIYKFHTHLDMLKNLEITLSIGGRRNEFKMRKKSKCEWKSEENKFSLFSYNVDNGNNWTISFSFIVRRG